MVCITDPIEITAGRTLIVHYYGFDFLEFQKEHQFAASIRYVDGGVPSPFPAPHINVSTNYHAAVEFQSVPLQNLDRSRGPQLVLSWGGQEVETLGGEESALAILIIPTPTNTPIPLRTITLEGSARIKDDEWGSDDYGDLTISPQTITLAPLTSHPFHFTKCVGGEVRLELDVTISLRENLIADADIDARLFEGTSCSTDDREERKTDRFSALPDGVPVPWTYTLRNTETDGGDWAEVHLTLTNRR